VVEQEDLRLENYAPSLELLKTAGILQDISNKPLVNRLLPPGKTGLANIVNRLRAEQEGRGESYYQHHQRSPAVAPAPASTQVVHLEPMYETDSGLMQSWRVSEDGETVGETYRAWQEAEQDKQCYRVWPNGHVTSSKETIKLVTGPTGQTFSVRVPVDAFASIDDIDSDDEDCGYTKYPCPTCRKTYSKIMSVFQHMVKVHDISMQEAKAKRKMINNQSVFVEGRRHSKKVSDNFSRPVKPLQVKLKNYSLDSKVPLNLCDKLSSVDTTNCPILSSSCLSDSALVQPRDLHKAESLNRLVAEREEREKEEDGLEEEVNNKLMEYVNRRRVECKVCGEQFSRTYLLKNHIAASHLKLERWGCQFCDFGSWAKYQAVNHAVMEHKYRNIESARGAVRERTREEYFDNNPQCQQTLPAPCKSRSQSPQLNNEDTAAERGVAVNGDIPDSPVSLSRNGSPSPKSSSGSPESLSSEEVGGGKRKRIQGSYNVKRSRAESQTEESSLKIVFSKVSEGRSRSSPSVSPRRTEKIPEARARARPGPKSRTRQLSASPGPPSPGPSRESSLSNFSDNSDLSTPDVRKGGRQRGQSSDRSQPQSRTSRTRRK